MDAVFLPNLGHKGSSIPETARVARQELPEFAPIAGERSVRSADLTLLREAPAGVLDTTHFDTAVGAGALHGSGGLRGKRLRH